MYQCIKRRKEMEREFLKGHVWSEQIYHFPFLHYHFTSKSSKTFITLTKVFWTVSNEETEPHLEIGCYLFRVIWSPVKLSIRPCQPAAVSAEIATRLILWIKARDVQNTCGNVVVLLEKEPIISPLVFISSDEAEQTFTLWCVRH